MTVYYLDTKLKSGGSNLKNIIYSFFIWIFTKKFISAKVGQKWPFYKRKCSFLIIFKIFRKNPYKNYNFAIRKSDSNTNDEDVGYVSLSASGSNIIIKTCIKTPCKKEENRLQDSIGIE